MSILAWLSLAAFFYLIVALQVAHGFPPFYEKYQGPPEDEIQVILFPFGLALLAILLASIAFPTLFFLFGVVSAWSGLRVRKSVQVRTNGPRAWLLHPVTIGVLNKWPMLAFDAWTLGVTALTGMLIFIAG